jgi:amino acid transporter
VQDAHRTYTRAMSISLIFVVLTYALPIVAVAHACIPSSAWETGSWVTFARLLGGERLAVFMTAAGMVAALSTFNTLVMALSRLPYAMARDGFLPKVFAIENARGAPWVAIVVCATFWALATVLGFEATVMLDVLLTGLSILLEFAALIALRIKEPNLARPFRVRGGYAGVILLSLPPAALIAISCARNHAERIGPLNSFTIGLCLVLLGVGFYIFGSRPISAR